MPTALDSSAPSAAPNGSVATQAPTSKTLSADFLALLANLNCAVPADETALPPGVVADTAEMADLLEGTTDDTDSEDDATSTEDEELLGMLALAGILQTPAPILSTSSKQSGSSALGPDSASQNTSAAGSQQPGQDTRDLFSLLSSNRETSVDLLGKLPELIVNAAADDSSVSNLAASLTGNPTQSSSTLPQHLHALTSAHTMRSDTIASREISAPVGSQAWAQQLGDEIAWMAQQGNEAASLKLTPEHLGPLEVRISMRDGEASVWFGAANADTRSALEQALPRLRELFASQGLSLADAGVFKEAPRQQSRQQSFDSNGASHGLSEGTGVSQASSLKSLRLLDTYA